MDNCYAFDALEDKYGNIWIGGQGAVSRYDEKSLLNEKVKGIQVFKVDGMFMGISEDKEGNI
ncbi:MAG: hypothetical protein H6573_09400 [Lewinellaceae bacterium]|nr:hypothetical protein [Phaeodactylibacter sp.]MCB9347710.1 hypothetical protein [Lewinellaceae bacterium]